MKPPKHKAFARYQELAEEYTTTSQTITLSIPGNLRMLCSLFGTSPKQILTDFMWTLSLMPDYGSPEQRKAAIHYFIQRGYAQQHYPEEDIHQIFRELEAKSILWPDIHDTHLNPEQRHLQCLWSNMWMEYWFEKWFWKHRKGEEK
ncbi:hypothetical protein ACFSJU_17435 [Paradesertivirga mongoliensis]|uniref:Uncharacterized protein n=1 Tax=Paradesertivirga mongoliensis TaxID=2100740 RepID=A0ABW4ZQU7_9SPHI|nr:hypothetical protein [Pedobacter mongoliensis]